MKTALTVSVDPTINKQSAMKTIELFLGENPKQAVLQQRENTYVVINSCPTVTL